MTTSLLQSLEGVDPKTKLSGASQVTLSEAEVRTLRRDMQEQENLIQGYQVVPTTFPADSAIQLLYTQNNTRVCSTVDPLPVNLLV